jgi:hypothetical protein
MMRLPTKLPGGQAGHPTRFRELRLVCCTKDVNSLCNFGVLTSVRLVPAGSQLWCADDSSPRSRSSFLNAGDIEKLAFRGCSPRLCKPTAVRLSTKLSIGRDAAEGGRRKFPSIAHAWLQRQKCLVRNVRLLSSVSKCCSLDAPSFLHAG